MWGICNKTKRKQGEQWTALITCNKNCCSVRFIQKKKYRTFTGSWFLFMTCMMGLGQWGLTGQTKTFYFQSKGRRVTWKWNSFNLIEKKRISLIWENWIWEDHFLIAEEKILLEDLSCFFLFSKPQTSQSAMTPKLFSLTHRATLPFPRAQPRALLAVSSFGPECCAEQDIGEVVTHHLRLFYCASSFLEAFQEYQARKWNLHPKEKIPFQNC